MKRSRYFVFTAAPQIYLSILLIAITTPSSSIALDRVCHVALPNKLHFYGNFYMQSNPWLAEDNTLHSTILFHRQPSAWKLRHCRRTISYSLTQVMHPILEWGAENIVQFTYQKTQSSWLSNRKTSIPNHTTINGQALENPSKTTSDGIKIP